MSTIRTISLVVKGNWDEAVAAAIGRGILALPSSRTERESILRCDGANWDRVVAWYIEDNGKPVPEGGYPAGTLLFYRELNKEEL